MKKYLLCLILPVVLAACGPKADTNVGSSVTPMNLNGEYRSADGKDTLVFSADGKVTSKNALVSDKVTTYTVKDGKVSYQFSNGFPRTMTLNNDGTLTSDSGTRFEKHE